MQELNDEAQRLLDKFLIENQELEALGAKLSAFNLFSVLRAEKVEIRHSNVLAWLLSPDESHGLGARFLRRFLSLTLYPNRPERISLTASAVELMDFSDVEVLREWQHIDVLVRSNENQLCLLIENKIKSKESKGQLERYKKVAEQEMPGFEIIPVFLTLNGEEPSEGGLAAGYIPLAHGSVHDLLQRIFSQHRSRMSVDAQSFVSQYLEVLRKITMKDEELIELCQKIYRKHREAIDLIVEYGAKSEVTEAIERAVTETVECDFSFQTSRSAWFLPKSLAACLPEVDLDGWNRVPKRVPVMLWCQYEAKKGRLLVTFEVGPMTNTQQRLRLLNAIKVAGLKVSSKGFREEARFTRVYPVRKKLTRDEQNEPDTSYESVAKTFKQLWGLQEPNLARMIEVIEQFDWEENTGPS